MPQDAELIELRQRVDCRTVLENAGWKLDCNESTRRAAKYRRGIGEIIIVTHEGKGWFDPLTEGCRGDVIALAQRLSGCNLGHARKVLRPLAGIIPSLLPMPQGPARQTPPPPSSWTKLRLPTPGSPARRYLTESRGLPTALLREAGEMDLIREGVRGTTLFAHKLRSQLVGWEMRGPSYKGFLSGGGKGLFVFAVTITPARIAVCESAIDALSLAAIEDLDRRTAYVSTGGGWGVAGRGEIERLLGHAEQLIGATDQGRGGDLLAARLESIAAAAAVRYERLRPAAKDWNEQLLSRSVGHTLLQDNRVEGAVTPQCNERI